MSDISLTINNTPAVSLPVTVNSTAAPIHIGTIGISMAGMSAFRSAIVGGYTGDEETFYADLAAMQGLAAELESLL